VFSVACHDSFISYRNQQQSIETFHDLNDDRVCQQEGRSINIQWVRGITLAAALAANCRSEVRSPETACNEIRITVFDEAHLPREALLDALDRLSLILWKARIVSHPVLGNPTDPEASLFMYVASPSTSEEPQKACGARREIALKIVGSSPQSLRLGVLGMASPFAALGLSVRIFNDHVSEAAFRHGLPQTIALSHAMAHEIGHVLLRKRSDGASGIMADIWTEHEYEQMARGALGFSEDEVKTMWANLQAPVCNNGSRPSWGN
jgi:hypothetical protein